MPKIPLASRLEGKKIGKWTVIKKRVKDDTDYSGGFASGYVVSDEAGNYGFLKAFNYQYAFQSMGGSANILKVMLDNYIYERDLLKFCADYNMRRVVTAIDSGEYREEDEPYDVPYLIFELAVGNLPKQRALKNPDLTWKLKSFHNTLVGLSQLHSADIAHQDIKPSNILIFGNDVSKISDLGCATRMGNESNWDQGDLRYAPIELLYSKVSDDWQTRRFGADLFMMGGLLTYLVTDSNFLALMLSYIPRELRPAKFQGTFEQAEPYLMDAYQEALEVTKAAIHPGVRIELIEIISELTHPIPEKRGNPQFLNIVRHRQFSLQRYISVMDRLSKKVSRI